MTKWRVKETYIEQTLVSDEGERTVRVKLKRKGVPYLARLEQGERVQVQVSATGDVESAYTARPLVLSFNGQRIEGESNMFVITPESPDMTIPPIDDAIKRMTKDPVYITFQLSHDETKNTPAE